MQLFRSINLQVLKLARFVIEELNKGELRAVATYDLLAIENAQFVLEHNEIHGGFRDQPLKMRQFSFMVDFFGY